MCDLGKTPLPDGLPFPGQETAPGVGCVGPWPRRAGAVGHKPRTPRAGRVGCVGPWPRRAGAVGHKPRTPRRRVRLAAACQTMNVASTTGRRPGPTGRLGDLAKIALSDRLPFLAGIVRPVWGAWGPGPVARGL